MTRTGLAQPQKARPSYDLFSSGDFLGFRLCDTGQDGLIRWLTEPDPRTVSPRIAGYLNAHTVNMALRAGSDLAPALRGFDVLYPDGMAVVREARRRGFDVTERVSAADFFPRFCWAAAARGRSVALVGGEEGLAMRCGEALAADIPGLKISLCEHGFLPTGSAERIRVCARLEEVRPDILLLGMGSPLQEQFGLELRDNLGLPTVWCVGALFEYYTPGVRRHAPLWMREGGLEWLFRLWQEPRRLARRYLLGNAEFLWRVRRMP